MKGGHEPQTAVETSSGKIKGNLTKTANSEIPQERQGVWEREREREREKKKRESKTLDIY